MQPCARIAGNPPQWSANLPPDSAQSTAEPPPDSNPDKAIEANPSDRKSFPRLYQPAASAEPVDSCHCRRPTNTVQTPSSENKTPQCGSAATPQHSPHAA